MPETPVPFPHAHTLGFSNAAPVCILTDNRSDNTVALCCLSEWSAAGGYVALPLANFGCWGSWSLAPFPGPYIRFFLPPVPLQVPVMQLPRWEVLCRQGSCWCFLPRCYLDPLEAGVGVTVV